VIRRPGKNLRLGKNLIARVPRQFGKWIDIEELKQIQVDVVDPAACRKIGRLSLADLLDKIR